MSTLRVNNMSDTSGSNEKNTNQMLTMPDWSSRTTLALNIDITMTARGWILMRNTEYTTRLSGYINGNKVYTQAGTSGYFEDWNSLFVPVDIGDVVKLSGGELTFIPCKYN